MENKLIKKFNKKVFPSLRWAGLSFLIIGGSYAFANKTKEAIQESQEVRYIKNISTLTHLADEDDSGFLDNLEVENMYEACGVELILKDGIPEARLTNKQLKKGIEHYTIKELVENHPR